MKITPITAAAARPTMASNASEEPAIGQRVDISVLIHNLDGGLANIEAATSLIINRTPRPNSEEDGDGHAERIQYLAQRILDAVEGITESMSRIRYEAQRSASQPNTISRLSAEKEGKTIACHVDRLDTAIGLVRRNIPKEDEYYEADINFILNCLLRHSEDLEDGVILKLLGHDRHAPEIDGV